MIRPLVPLLLAALLALSGAAAAEPRFLGLLRLDTDAVAHLGGLSAIEMSRDGRHAWLLSDRGFLFRATITRSDGRILRAAVAGPIPVTDANATRSAGTADFDSEGLALWPGDRLAISFEGRDRIAIHGVDGRERMVIAPPPGSDALARNRGYEALAIDARGRLVTLAENAPGGGAIPLYRHAGGRWAIVGAVPHGGGFRPVGLDFDDRGRLYLLERRFTVPFGFSSRITRFAMENGMLGPGERLLETAPGEHGNLEGLSLWRAGSGALIASMVSDDNNYPLLSTNIVEYVLPDTVPTH